MPAVILVRGDYTDIKLYSESELINVAQPDSKRCGSDSISDSARAVGPPETTLA
jgi:hypothetical protein